MQRSGITTINNITQTIANPAAGDAIFLNIDETLLLTGFRTFSDDPKLTEPGLPAEILRLQERGIRVVGLTARSFKKSQATLAQLKLAGIQFEVIHAPDISYDDGSMRSGKGKALREYLDKICRPKRIFVFDNLRHHLEAVQSECEDLGIPLLLKHYVVPDFQPVHVDAESNAFFPEKLDGFQKEQALGGGTASVFSIRHPERDQRLVLKLGAHEDGAKVEMLCNALYRILGVPVPKMRVYHTLPKNLAMELGLKNSYRFAQVCEFIQSGTTAQPGIIKKTARDHFVTHALLGNIDVAKDDNFIVDEEQNAYLIDAGANFLFRSLGQQRKESPDLVSEMETLRDKSFNEKGPSWFGDLTADEIRQQLQEILCKQHELTEAVWSLSRHVGLPDQLRDKFLQCLSDRLDALVTQYRIQPQAHAKFDKRAQKDKTSAGILTYTMKDGEPHILLSKRVRHEWWDNFGGKSEAGDESLLATARREVAEESGGLLNYTDLELLNSPFHDMVTGNGVRDQQLYRMYVTAYEYIDQNKFHDHEHTAHQWVPLKDILAALDSKLQQQAEGQDSVAVKCGEQSLLLYPPLLAVLQQKPVRETLNKLLRVGRVTLSHTLGYDNAAQGAGQVDGYRPVLTPVEKRQQIAVSMEKKSHVMRELKQRCGDEARAAADTGLNHCQHSSVLSQSEIHLKTMLGRKYVDHDLAENVRQFVGMNFLEQTGSDRDRLIQLAAGLIENEKRGGDKKIYFYHACSNSISFAYDVYTALYQALQQDPQWSAFRLDSAHFKRFLTINEFVAFYSENGSKLINNNDQYFNDCALSANVFLFGNHTTETSCSINYLIGNDVRRRVDLSALFSELLRPFLVTTAEIKRILSLFERHLGEQGGRLYQIAMPLEQARMMSYPAGYAGVMNKLDGDHELPSVLQKLRDQVTSSAGVSFALQEYMQHLQARVMVPPHLKLETTEVKWKQMAEAAHDEYRASLNSVVSGIVHKILCHHDALHGGASAPLLKVLPGILQSNQLSYSGAMIEAVLVRAIYATDTVTVRNILHAHPELLARKITAQRDYIQGRWGYGGQYRQPMTIMEMILQSALPADVLIDFSVADWAEQFSAAHIHQYTDFYSWLTRMPDQYCLALVMQNIHLLVDDNQLEATIKRLSMQDRITVIRHNLERIRFNKSLIRFAPYLPRSEAILLAREKLNDFDGLCCVLSLFDNESDRMQEISSHMDMIVSAQELIEIIKLIPEASRFDFAKKNQDKIVCARNVYKIMRVLPTSKKITFARLMQHLIIDGVDIAAVLDALTSESALIFTRNQQHKIRDGSDLNPVLARLSRVDARALLLAHQHKITCGDPVAGLMEYLSADFGERLSFAKCYQDKIISCNELADVIDKLNARDRYGFAKGKLMLIKTCSELLAIVSVLPQSARLEFLRLKEDVIQCGEDVCNLMLTLSENDRIAFVLANKCKCMDLAVIENILEHLGAMRHRFAFATACQDLFTTDDSYYILFSLLDADELIRFLGDNIKNVSALKYLLRCLQPQFRVATIMKYSKLIADGDQLHAILTLLRHEERMPVIMAHHDLLDSENILVSILLLLSKEDCLRLATMKRKLITSSNVLMTVCSMLPVHAVKEFMLAGIVDFLSLSCVLAASPDEFRAGLARCCGNFIGSRELAQVLVLLPGADRLAFALDHLDRIKDRAQFDIVGGCFTGDEYAVFMAAGEGRFKKSVIVAQAGFALFGGDLNDGGEVVSESKTNSLGCGRG